MKEKGRGKKQKRDQRREVTRAGGPTPGVVAESGAEIEIAQEDRDAGPEERLLLPLHSGPAELNDESRDGEKQKRRQREQAPQRGKEREQQRAEIWKTDSKKSAQVPWLIRRVGEVHVAGLQRMAETALVIGRERQRERNRAGQRKAEWAQRAPQPRYIRAA